ncbi:hypothetical protein [Mesorhizobium sp.]|uniref:hypothetical protein n=1 Tax=Mesorhizobium sp. TaxID=1871066 RepID=UPI00260063D3|nr:hypothetical protein [Mesorhizobium sp.]
MIDKMLAAVALVASTAGVLAPSAALARDRDHHGGWQNRDGHSQGGYGNHGYSGRGGHGYNTGYRHYGGYADSYYNNSGYYPRQHGYERQHGYHLQHGYERERNQHFQGVHDGGYSNYRGH